ncbi:hypothetical protein CPB85DRAFT_1289884 [Mucidula mucida]|nr:hypothetical protein CPB85DRAFT_1289884 [Mucidula mucida]
MMHNDIAVPLEDIYIEKTSPKITTPIPCAPYLLCDRDFLEYSMGFKRGEMDPLLETETSFNTTVREDVCESLFKHGWGLMQSEDQLNHIVDFCWSNYDGGVKKRVCYKDEFPTQPSYTYILLYNEKHGQLHLPNGQPCISGQTRVSTTLHPLLAVVIAMDFAVFNFKWNFEDPIHDSLLALGRCMTRPLWLSWFQDRPRPQFTTIRPQAKAIRDLAMHL